MVKNHFTSTSNDDKVAVSFMNGPGREIIAAVGNAARSFVAHMDMGLLPAYSGNGTPSPGPAHPGGGGPLPGGGGPPPPPATTAACKKGSAGEAAAAPAGKRARTQESESPAAKSRAIAVTVDGDSVRTRCYEYSCKEIEDTLGRSWTRPAFPRCTATRTAARAPR
jgi:hypothetical protein